MESDSCSASLLDVPVINARQMPSRRSVKRWRVFTAVQCYYYSYKVQGSRLQVPGSRFKVKAASLHLCMPRLANNSPSRWRSPRDSRDRSTVHQFQFFDLRPSTFDLRNQRSKLAIPPFLKSPTRHCLSLAAPLAVPLRHCNSTTKHECRARLYPRIPLAGIPHLSMLIVTLS